MTISQNHLTEVLDFSGRASYSADHLATKPDARRVCRGRAAAARRQREDRLGRRAEPPEGRRESAPLGKRAPEPQQGPFSICGPKCWRTCVRGKLRGSLGEWLLCAADAQVDFCAKTAALIDPGPALAVTET